MQKIMRKLYIVAFITVLFVPFLFAHRQENRIAVNENRYYANVPKLIKEDGAWNLNYKQEFESWINDNARFRTLFREMKVIALYHLFGYLDLENVGIGTNGDLYANADKDVDTVQGRNLLSDGALEALETGLYRLQEALKFRGIDFYYMQCYDKMTILSEYYPKGVMRYQTEHIGQQTEDYILENNRVNIVPLYDMLKSVARSENIYYRYVDWCHWNEAGMYLGYEKLMKKIGEKYPQTDYLKLEDYSIKYKEAYRDVYGFQYPLKEIVPVYEIKEKKAVEKETTLYNNFNVKEHTHYYVNPTKTKRVLCINDSFIRMAMKSHLAECFHEVLTVDLNNLSNIEWILDAYAPDIVILECLETNVPNVYRTLDNLEYIK